MKRRNKVIGLIIASVIGVSLIAGCNKGIFNHTPEKKAQWIVEEVADELELNDSQLVKLNAIKNHVLTLRKEMKAKHESTHEELMGMLSADTIDQVRLNDMLVEKLDTVKLKAPEFIAVFSDFIDSLNQKQKHKLQKAIKKLKSRHHSHS